MPNSPTDPIDAVRHGAKLPTRIAIPPAVRSAAMLEHPTLAVASIRRGRIREINAAWHALFALPPDVSVESHVATLFPNSSSADRFERLLKAEFSAARNATLASRSEQLLMRRDGSAFLCEVIVWLLDLDDVEHPLVGDAIWQVRDITVERSLRRDLRDLEDYHRELSRQQPGITLVIDRKGRLSYASASIESILGYPVNTLLGEPFSLLLEAANAHAAEQWLRAAGRSDNAADAAGDEFALRLVDRDGATRDFAGRSVNCFRSPRIAGVVVHADEAVLDAAGRPAHDGLAVDGRRLRSALLASACGDDTSTAALLKAIRTTLGAASAVCWGPSGPSHPARWAVRATALGQSGEAAEASEAAPPLVSGDLVSSPPDVLAIVDVEGMAPDAAVAALQASGIAAVVEAPMYADGKLVGWLAVGAALARHWLDAEIDFVVGGALLVARSLERSSEPVPDAPATDRMTAGLDPLTGLADRASAERHLAESTSSIDAPPLLVIAIDLDGLEDVNDSRGHAAGDRVVLRTAAVLSGIAGPQGFVARVDGDEFLVVVRLSDVHDIASLTQAVLDGIADVGNDDAIGTQVEASIGVTRFPLDAPDGASLWLQAGLALREAKSRGRAQAFVFNPKLAANLRLRKALDAEIDEALRREEFTVFYQPQLSLSTGRVVGFEALLRWQHPERGLLLPDAFIQAAFQRGLVDVITKLVLTQVCERIASWRRSTPPFELPVSVNVSGRQFHDRRLPALVASALLKSGLPARLLVLEITEQSLVGDEAGIERVVRELSRLGVRIAIGDFNLGHASFKYLKQLRVSQIKLGGHFVKGLPDDTEDVMLVAAVVDLAHRLGYEVIAEGVETRAQFEHLRSIGCETGQGFHLGAPLSADDIGAYLESNRDRPVR